MLDDERQTRPRPTSSAKSMLLTILGEFVLPDGGDVWTGTLADGLVALGYSERNARQAMARLRDEGVIRPERHGRRTRWHLTEEGRLLLSEGAERIYGFGRGSGDWDGRWLVLVCSIPETQREKRRLLQTRLTFAGFGFTSPTMAVSPHVSAEATANRIVQDLDLAEIAIVVKAETGSLTPDRELLDRSWDLDDLRSAYDRFSIQFQTVQPDGPEAAFCETARLVHAWRHFPFIDPDLPPELLPSTWAGRVARDLFDDARRRWQPDATAHYKMLESRHG